MLEELLEAGFPVETAVQMMNTALVIGREEVRFCTVDVSLFDLYGGSCEICKGRRGNNIYQERGQSGNDCINNTANRSYAEY